MAFDRKQLVHTHGGDVTQNHSFEYYSTDTVTTAGYFPNDDILKAGDKVVTVVIGKTAGGLVESRTETAYVLTDNADGVLTAVAMS